LPMGRALRAAGGAGARGGPRLDVPPAVGSHEEHPLGTNHSDEVIGRAESGCVLGAVSSTQCEALIMLAPHAVVEWTSPV
jgi:hypothetical protein